MVNWAMITPKKSKKVPVILANTNSYNIWIRQPLLAANIVEVESCPWDYQTILSHDGKDISVSFCPVPHWRFRRKYFQLVLVWLQPVKQIRPIKSKIKVRNQNLVLDLNLIVHTFDFQKELDRLPFPLNLGKVKMSKVQQIRFLELIYDNQSVFFVVWGFRSLWLPQTHHPYYNG